MNRLPISGGDHAYFTLISTPDGCEPRDLAQLLSKATGWDEPTLRLSATRIPPAIIGEFPRHECESAIRALIDAGGDAFAPIMSEIERLGGTLKVRDMRSCAGGVEVDIWRGSATTIRASEIQILVRAKLSEVTTRHLSGTYRGGILTAGLAGWGWSMGGSYGLAAGLHARSVIEEPRIERTISCSDKLDIHTTNGLVYQIDGDKFGFAILGEQKGHSDHVNVDRMCELMVHLSREAVVDPYFTYWHAPASIRRLRLPFMSVNNDDPAFAFYSRWAALMYRHVMGLR